MMTRCMAIALTLMLGAGTALAQEQLEPAQALRRMMIRDLTGAGQIERLGVRVEASPEALAAQIGLPQGAGLVVQSVDEGSVAAEAGIRQHDVLHKLDDQVLVNADQLRQLLDGHEKGDKVTFTVVRAARPVQVEATLGEKPAPRPLPEIRAMRVRMIKAPFLGVATEPLNAEQAEKLDLDARTQGLFVHAVIDGSPAAEAVLQPHDVIQKIDDQPVHHPNELRKIIRAAKAGDEVTLDVLRGGEVVQVKAKLVEREVPERGGRFVPADRLFLVRPGELGELGEFPHDAFELRMNEMLEEMGPEMQDMREQMQRMLREMQERTPLLGLEGPEFRLEIPEGLAAGGVSVTTVADGEHVITLTRNADGTTLLAKDADGNVIFEGPYNTDEDKAKVPAEIREKVDRIKVRPFRGKPDEPKPNLMV